MSTKNSTVKLRFNLKELLEGRKMSIREFSARIDYRFETVRKMVNEDLYRIPVDLIERVCLELGCGIDDLFTLEYSEVVKDEDDKNVSGA